MNDATREDAASASASHIPRFARGTARFAVRNGAPIVLALFLIVGLAVVDDYGVPTDIGTQLGIGRSALAHIQGNQDARDNNINYGAAFEIPLAVIERVLGGENSRAVYLTRHALTHALFLAGGFFAWLLTYRMFGNRLLALFAMLIFLLHPRLYAHSFFNSKDLAFLSMFMISLYLIHRAFRRDSVWAFALCGAGVGLLANIRILGVMPFAAVLGLLALDMFHAVRAGKSGGRVLANGAAFSLAAVLTLYATWPQAWDNPLGVVESFLFLSRYPLDVPELFMGDVIGMSKPPHYVPTWILITTPPAALVPIIAGIACATYAGAARWRDAIRNTDARFALLLVGFAVLPVLVIIVLDSTLYNGWRHMFFLYAPLCPLAALGARRIWAALSDKNPRYRLALGALAAVGIAAVVVQMVRLHPYQSDYFNLLVNRNVSGQYVVDYWDLSRRDALEWLLETYPDLHLIVRGEAASRWDLDRNLFIMPEEDRRRISVREELAHFHIAESGENPVWTREVYGVPMVAVMDTRAATESAYRAAHETAAALEPVAESGFDIYLDGKTLIYVREPCEEGDADGRFLLSAFPVSPDDLPADFSALGLNHAPLNFEFRLQGAIFDGKCVIMHTLPDFPIGAIETGQYVPGGEALWNVTVVIDPVRIAAYRQAHQTAMASEPIAESGFDIYLDGKTLIYIKEPCAETDAGGRFLLSAFPTSPDDLPTELRGQGHESLNFYFDEYGARSDGRCVIARALPDFPVGAIETGQYVPGGEALWSVIIHTDPDRLKAYRQAHETARASQPIAESGFDVYLDDNALIYIKEPCAAGDADGRFLLSAFPVSEDDLPPEFRGLGHHPLNFGFDAYGAIFDGKCVMLRTLPSYPIAWIETGQWIEDGGDLWTASADMEGSRLDAYRQAYETARASNPIAESGFDVYLDGDTLIYVKEPCAAEDTRGRFLLSAFPVSEDDLPTEFRGLGHHPLNFGFDAYGAIFDGKCVIMRTLPDYPIAAVETGQWVPGGDRLWTNRIPIGE